MSATIHVPLTIENLINVAVTLLTILSLKSEQELREPVLWTITTKKEVRVGDVKVMETEILIISLSAWNSCER